MPRGDKLGSIKKLRVTRLIKGRRKQIDVWEVRKRFTGPIVKNYRRVAYSADQAQKTMRAIEKDFADKVALLTAYRSPLTTFADLADHYETNYLKPPLWIDDRKVEGLRSWDKARRFLKPLRERFDDTLLRDINWASLAEFKSERLRTPVVIKHGRRSAVTEPGAVATGPSSSSGSRLRTPDSRPSWTETRQRSMASVHQPLKLARRMFNIAIRLGWITENPFSRGDALIIRSHERKRMRILSRLEEAKLLSFCTGRRGYLADAIMVAIDTAARQNEQLTLMVDDVHLEKRFMRIREHNAKIAEARVVPITARLVPVLERLIEQSGSARIPAGGAQASLPALRLFPPGTATRIKRTFQSVCRLAGIENFRWHDLRHTGTMRMLDAIKDPAKVMKITGHKQWSTFMVYVNIDEEIALEVANAMDAARAGLDLPIEERETVN